MPRHKLGDEQIALLHRNTPRAITTPRCGVGGMPGTRHVGNGDERENVPTLGGSGGRRKGGARRRKQLCKHGRGGKAVKCPFYDTCAYQQQKQFTANIWFAAHECAVHEMPKTFGDVGWVIFDENPLDAFMFGVDINDQVTDWARHSAHTAARSAKPNSAATSYGSLMWAREKLYDALDKLQVPIEFHQGVAVPRKSFNPWSFEGETTCHLAGNQFNNNQPRQGDAQHNMARHSRTQHPAGHAGEAIKDQAARGGVQRHDKKGSHVVGTGRSSERI